MLEEHKGKETAKRLLASTEPQTGLHKLWELGYCKKSIARYLQTLSWLKHIVGWLN
jgi:hypothetical protein